jgi:hypothetical protein
MVDSTGPLMFVRMEAVTTCNLTSILKIRQSRTVVSVTYAGQVLALLRKDCQKVVE